MASDLLKHQMEIALTAVSNDNKAIMTLLDQTMEAIGVLNSRVVFLEKEISLIRGKGGDDESTTSVEAGLQAEIEAEPKR